ncbi:MAG: peptide ABC transporter ATP-binding protein [Desulfitibacter sp. BRH_c19]|nr:MAG: peptide ABC transporter ATP-binding protein [Desulfitibacter sp. BRH_c19]
MGANLLEVNNLSAGFSTNKGNFQVLTEISFTLKAGEALGIVGESGCGKSVTALSIMGLLPYLGKVTQGNIYFEGNDLLTLKDKEMQKIRGNNIAMIFQDPITALNPVHTIGDQIAEAIMIHKKVSKKAAMVQAIDALRLVMIPMPELRLKEYSYQMSGGMSQRIMIAMALSCNPRILLADEPTAALDVTTQSQIIDLMIKAKEELGTAIIFISHNLGVIAEMAQRVAVMYAGRIVELSYSSDIFEDALHPYTEGLLKSMPGIHNGGKEKLHVINGSVPHPMNMPAGCPFHPRCPYMLDICKERTPNLVAVTREHYVSCWKVDAK